MKKILILICTILCANVLLAQQFTNVIIPPLKYDLSSNGEATVVGGDDTNPTTIVIPDFVTYNGTDYLVTEIAQFAFKQNTALTSLEIGANVREISKQAFKDNENLSTIIFHSLTPPTMTENNTFQDHAGANLTIPYSWFVNNSYGSIFGKNGLNGNNVVNVTGCVEEGTTVTITGTETIYAQGDYVSNELHMNSLIINGTLIIGANGQLVNNSTNPIVIGQDGQLINKSENNVSGVIEVVTPAEENKWNFVGAPFNGYDLYAMKLGPGNTDATVVEFDYTKKIGL